MLSERELNRKGTSDVGEEARDIGKDILSGEVGGEWRWSES